MIETKELLMTGAFLAYGIICYIIGRTNLLEAVIVRKLQDLSDGLEERVNRK